MADTTENIDSTDEVVAGIEEVHAEGEGRLAQVLDLMFYGTVVAQASTACGQRVWNRQPEGGRSALGTSPLTAICGRVASISGSGMGCGDHWPRCYGRWFPPLNRPDLIIEVSHRYLASILLLALVTLGLKVAIERRMRSRSDAAGAATLTDGGVLPAAFTPARP